MNKKFYALCLFLFLFSVVFRGFSATQTNSGSGSMNAPQVKFKEWQIGRSAKGTNTSNAVHLSFITSTQTLCRFTASVGYVGGSQPSNTSPIDPATVKWSVIDASHSMKLDKKSLQQNWSGKHPSKFDASTSFNVVGALTVPKVVGERTVKTKTGSKKVPDYLTATACTQIDDANRANRSPVHRNGTKMKFKIKFTAQTKSGQNVEVVLPLKADDKDQIRQEYVDYNRPVPSRGDSKWTAENTYDFGHYKKMFDVGLGGKKSKWVTEINKLRGTNRETGEKIPAFSASDFVVTSGYRNPHHNFDHANSTSLLSSHMYGYALDVRGKSLAGNKLLDINGDRRNTDADRALMVEAAKPNAGARHANAYPSKHVHADWGPSNWASRRNTSSAAPTFSLPTAGTDTTSGLTTTTPTTPSTPVSSTSTLFPSGGSYTASAGSTHTANVTLPSVYSSIFWYIKSPSESGLGTSMKWVSGDGSSTSASYSWSVPSGASGDYVITAYTYLSDNSVVQPSYTVTVGSSTSSTPSSPSSPSTSSTPTDNTPDCSYCTDGCSSCQTSSDSDDDDDSGDSIGPASGYSDTGTAGRSYAVTLMASAPFSTVLWYVQTPGSSESLWNTNSYYNGTTTTSDFYWYFYDGVSGDYVFRAEVTPVTGDSYSKSYTVSVTVE